MQSVQALFLSRPSEALFHDPVLFTERQECCSLDASDNDCSWWARARPSWGPPVRLPTPARALFASGLAALPGRTPTPVVSARPLWLQDGGQLI